MIEAPLSETRARKCELKFLKSGADMAGLAKLVDACLRRGVMGNHLELGIAHGQV